MKERENPQCLSAREFNPMKKSKSKSKHGGRRPGAGRKPMGTIPGRQLPWRIPGDDYARTVAAVKAMSGPGREPGRVIVEAIAAAAKAMALADGHPSAPDRRLA
jgi:hypothetical protein